MIFTLKLSIEGKEYYESWSNLDCYKTSIDVGSSIDCLGWYSCYISKLKVIISSNRQILCNNGFSCDQAGLTSSGRIFCYGEQSCWGAQIEASFNVLCYGEGSCGAVHSIKASEICQDARIIESSGKLECNGWLGCANTAAGLIKLTSGSIYC